MTLHAVVLAGGSGTRFWPRSTRARPKQFLPFGGERTLFQHTVDRLAGLVPPERILVVTGEAYGPIVREQVPTIPAGHVLLEPAPRDTAAAIGFAAKVVEGQSGPDACLAVLASDHWISPDDAFRAALAEGESFARQGRLVTLGIRPTGPSTAYGYIRRGAPIATEGPFRAFEVDAFEEKPLAEVAKAHLLSGLHSWNAGIFVFQAGRILAELATHLPDTSARLERVVAARDGPDARDVLAREWRELAKISIDYAVLERAKGIVVIEVDFQWSDVGSWDAAGGRFASDDRENAVDGATFVGVDAARNVVAGDGRLITIVGLDDIVVVQHGDATLVCRRSRGEDVKKLVQELEARGLRDVL